MNALIQATDISAHASLTDMCLNENAGNNQANERSAIILKKQTDGVYETIRYIRGRSCAQMMEYRKTLGTKLKRVEELNRKAQNMKHEIVSMGGSFVRQQSFSPLSVPSSLVEATPTSSISDTRMVVNSFVHQNTASIPDPVAPPPFIQGVQGDIENFENDLQELITIRDAILRQIGDPLPSQLTSSS